MGGVQSSLRMLWEGRRVLVTSAEKLCTPPTPLNNDRSLNIPYPGFQRGVTALIPSVLGGFVKILGDLASYIGNWEVYEKSWVITSIMLGIGGFEENHGEYYQSNWELGVYANLLLRGEFWRDLCKKRRAI